MLMTVRVSRDLGLVLFADDTNLFAEGKDPVELYGRVNRGLGELNRWFRCNRLTLNLKKTEYVYFSGPGGGAVSPEVLEIGGEQIRRAREVKFLGVWVDEGLRWRDHIGRVIRKARQLLGVLGRAGSVLEGRLLASLYNGLVLPHLQYCLMVWGTLPQIGMRGMGRRF